LYDPNTLQWETCPIYSPQASWRLAVALNWLQPTILQAVKLKLQQQEAQLPQRACASDMLYRTVQEAFRYVKLFRCGSRV